jgi:hypothetical protein
VTEAEKKEIIALIESLAYGEIIIKKEAGKIVYVKRGETIKLSE